MRHRKRAQVQAEVFIYILAVVITSAILLFGYVAIRDFIQKGEQAAFIKLKTDMERDATSIRNDFGTVRIKEYQIPPKYRQVCFVGEDRIRTGDAGPPAPTGLIQDAILRDSITSKVQKNVFFMPDGTDSIYVGPITAPSDFLCVDAVQGNIKVRLEGKGDKTLVDVVPGP